VFFILSNWGLSCIFIVYFGLRPSMLSSNEIDVLKKEKEKEKGDLTLSLWRQSCPLFLTT
jgi:hypothetical protein